MGSNNRIVYNLISSHKLPADRVGRYRTLPSYCITFYICIILHGGLETWSGVLNHGQELNHKRGSACTISYGMHIDTIPKSVQVDGVNCVLSISLGLYLVT